MGALADKKHSSKYTPYRVTPRTTCFTYVAFWLGIFHAARRWLSIARRRKQETIIFRVYG